MNELYHFGIKGMKWKNHIYKTYQTTENRRSKSQQNTKSNNDQKPKMSAGKKVAIGAAIVGGTLLAAYGAYKVKDVINNKNTTVKRGEKSIAQIIKNASKITNPTTSVNGINISESNISKVNTGKSAASKAISALTLTPSVDGNVDYNSKILKNMEEINKYFLN